MKKGKKHAPQRGYIYSRSHMNCSHAGRRT